ncbi:hypothetical protein BJ912DRAFT_933756 [Pholiota molesta]|nr:hypothetical protein BJ912DRAFT_933756 [Pholiota molesta]
MAQHYHGNIVIAKGQGRREEIYNCMIHVRSGEPRTEDGRTDVHGSQQLDRYSEHENFVIPGRATTSACAVIIARYASLRPGTPRTPRSGYGARDVPGIERDGLALGGAGGVEGEGMVLRHLGLGKSGLREGMGRGQCCRGWSLERTLMKWRCLVEQTADAYGGGGTPLRESESDTTARRVGGMSPVVVKCASDDADGVSKGGHGGWRCQRRRRAGRLGMDVIACLCIHGLVSHHAALEYVVNGLEDGQVATWIRARLGSRLFHSIIARSSGVQTRSPDGLSKGGSLSHRGLRKKLLVTPNMPTCAPAKCRDAARCNMRLTYSHTCTSHMTYVGWAYQCACTAVWYLHSK